MKILVIAPHMDDEVLGIGGTICKHVKQGDTVRVLFVANRAYNHRYDPSLIQREKDHALMAKAILGYQDAKFADLNDEQLDDKLAPVIQVIEEFITDFKPDVVYVNHRGDVNQDHKAVFEATMIACRPISSLGRHRIRRLLCYEILSSTDQAPPFQERSFLPNYYVDISAFLPKKQQALECYQTELRIFPHPRSLEGLRVLAQKRGMEVGWPAAEAFVIVRDEWA